MSAAIQLDKTQLDQLLHKAIVDSLGADGQQRIIDAVIKHLTRPQGNGGFRGGVNYEATSILQDLLNDSAQAVARQVCREKVENDPEFRAKVESVYADAAAKLFSVENREKLVEKMADKMGEALSSYR